MFGLKKDGIEINRKMLAELAVTSRPPLRRWPSGQGKLG
jgi:ribosomal protein L20